MKGSAVKGGSVKSDYCEGEGYLERVCHRGGSVKGGGAVKGGVVVQGIP